VFAIYRPTHGVGAVGSRESRSNLIRSRREVLALEPPSQLSETAGKDDRFSLTPDSS